MFSVRYHRWENYTQSDRHQFYFFGKIDHHQDKWDWCGVCLGWDKLARITYCNDKKRPRLNFLRCTNHDVADWVILYSVILFGERIDASVIWQRYSRHRQKTQKHKFQPWICWNLQDFVIIIKIESKALQLPRKWLVVVRFNFKIAPW